MTEKGQLIQMRLTNFLAAAGLSSPAFWPRVETASALHVASHYAALAVPILSAIWLFLQILAFIRKGGAK